MPGDAIVGGLAFAGALVLVLWIAAAVDIAAWTAQHAAAWRARHPRRGGGRHGR
ncbi:hypothetical protein [Streptomyces sp. NPDC050560]|uniref:hypothetical protein n=1 Tax=Streptomyces sp. NPDC050560 TaxID=3365630 RepID=UPI00379E9F00